MAERNCDKCVYGRRSGNCTAWNCKGTVTVEDIKAEARQSAIDEFIKRCKATHDGLISNWNKPYAITFERMEEIAEQLKENNNG